MPPEEQPHIEYQRGPHELPVANLAPRRKRSPLFWLFVLLALAAITVLAIFLLGRRAGEKAPATTTTSQSQTPATTKSVTSIDSQTKHHDASNPGLGFDYPADWSVSDQDQGKITVISPMLKLKTASNQVIPARIVMTIQNAQTSLPQFAGNTALAPLESQRLTYKSPTPNQRAHTYLTAVNYRGSKDTVEAFYITSDNGYTAGQYIPQSDVIKADPLVNLSFFACVNADCSDYSRATRIITSSWADANLSKPLIDMLQSLTID